jgi:hypothetical protein
MLEIKWDGRGEMASSRIKDDDKASGSASGIAEPLSLQARTEKEKAVPFDTLAGSASGSRRRSMTSEREREILMIPPKNQRFYITRNNLAQTSDFYETIP